MIDQHVGAGRHSNRRAAGAGVMACSLASMTAIGTASSSSSPCLGKVHFLPNDRILIPLPAIGYRENVRMNAKFADWGRSMPIRARVKPMAFVGKVGVSSDAQGGFLETSIEVRTRLRSYDYACNTSSLGAWTEIRQGALPVEGCPAAPVVAESPLKSPRLPSRHG